MKQNIANKHPKFKCSCHLTHNSSPRQSLDTQASTKTHPKHMEKVSMCFKLLSAMDTKAFPKFPPNT